MMSQQIADVSKSVSKSGLYFGMLNFDLSLDFSYLSIVSSVGIDNPLFSVIGTASMQDYPLLRFLKSNKSISVIPRWSAISMRIGSETVFRPRSIWDR